jgi:hypothetical protein
VRFASPKRARRLATRRELIARAIPTSCPVCGQEAATETHEILARSARTGTEADLRFMEPLGPACHRWVSDHKQQAHDIGLVLWSYEADDEEAIRAAQQARLDWEMSGRPR